jgi:hypothetical protein
LVLTLYITAILVEKLKRADPMVQKILKIENMDMFRKPVPKNIAFKALTPEVKEFERKIRNKLLFITLTVFIIFVFSILLLLSRISINFGPFPSIYILFIISIIFYFIFLVPEFIDKVSRDYDDDFKRHAESLIAELMKDFKDGKIDPKIYPLKLRHNDYWGLIYDKKDEYDYTAYVGIFQN